MSGDVRFLECIIRHLRAQQRYFHEVHLWLNTLDKDLITIGIRLCEIYASWVKVVPSLCAIDGKRSLPQFFSYCVAPNTCYLYIPLGICWICPDFVGKMFESRERDSMHPLILASTLVNRHDAATGTCTAMPLLEECNDDDAYNDTITLLKQSSEDSDDNSLFDTCSQRVCYAWRGMDMPACMNIAKRECVSNEAVCVCFAVDGVDRRSFMQQGFLTRCLNAAPKFQDDTVGERQKILMWSHLFT